MQFRLAHLLFAVTLVAVFFAMRRWWIASEDAQVAGWAVIVVAVLCGVCLGTSKCDVLVLLAGSALTGFLAASAFAVERIFHSPDTEFLRRYEALVQYSDGLKWNAFEVVALTFISAFAGGLAGVTARLLTRKTGCH